MAEQASPQTGRLLDVAAFLEGLGMTRFHTRLLVISCLVTFFDGLDFSLIAFTLPYLRDEMNLTDAMIGYVSAAAFVGQMIGSLIGSYIADILGRRPVILWCTVFGAALTFVTGFAQTPETLIALRFLGGIAIGGLLAPAWSINIETMPSGKKATAVTIIMLGFSAGGAAAGQVTNFIAPMHGWEGVFFFCGGMTALLAVVLQFVLPESVRWMTAKGKPMDRIVPMLKRFAPAADLGGYTGVMLSDEGKVSRKESPWAKFYELFRGSLAIITPIIWATYFCSSFAIYLKSSFGLLFLEELGIARGTAANLSSIGGLTGAIAGVFLLGFTEKRGPVWIALAPLLGIPAALAIGWGLDSGPLFIPLVLFGSIMVGTGHAAVISLTTIYYPSAVRSTGGGWASFMAKFAAVAAPILGAHYFLADKAAVLDGYVFTGLCLAGVVVGILALAFFARRLHAERQADAAVAAEAAEAAIAEPSPAYQKA